MAKFAWPWKEIGLDSEPWRYESTIPIRLGDRNLLLLRAAESSTTHPVRYDAGHVKVEEIDNKLALGRFELYLDSLEVSGSARKDLMDKMWPLIQHDLLSLYSKLFEVTGKVLGPTTLQVGKMTQKLEVIPWASYTVSFRFLKPYSGDKKRPDGPVAGTTRSPAEIDDWISNLNWIFGSQANITFEKGTSDWFTSETWLGPLTQKSFTDLGFESKQDGAADITVFLVGVVGDAYAETYLTKSDSWITLMPDRPPQTYTSDPFIGTLAHELSHFVEDKDTKPRNAHFCEQGILRGMKPESTKIGDVLRPRLVKPGSTSPPGTLCD
jgi:hypothetical protein